MPRRRTTPAYGYGQKSVAVVTGDKALDRKLKRLGKDGVRASYKGLGAAMTVLARAMRKNAPVGPTKQLKKAIGKRVVKPDKKHVASAKVGVNVKKKKEKQAPHAHLVILGTSLRFHRTGKSVGAIQPGYDFVAMSFQQSAGAAKAAQIAKTKTELMKLAKKK